MATTRIRIAAALAAGFALTLANCATAQEGDQDGSQTVSQPLVRAKTLHEMNNGRDYLGMNHPSKLSASHQAKPESVDFMRKAAVDWMTVVKLGELAQEKGSSDAVKEFGKRLAEDHSIGSRHLNNLASDLGVELPTAMDPKHEALFEKISLLEGEAFDQAYVKVMLDYYEKAVHQFTAHANNGRNSDIRSWTATALPTLRKDRDIARILSASIAGP
jgi:putative membrane protein